MKPINLDTSNVMETNEKQYELILVNDEGVDGYGVLFSLLQCFPNYTMELINKIVEEVENNGEAPCMTGTLDECKKSLNFLTENKIPAKIKEIGEDIPISPATHKIVLIDTLSIDGLTVAEILRDVLKISWCTAIDIVEKVDHSNTDTISCFKGSKEECEKFSKLLQDNDVPCEVKKND